MEICYNDIRISYNDICFSSRGILSKRLRVAVLKSQGETGDARFHLLSPPRLHPLLPYPSAFQESDETGEGQ